MKTFPEKLPPALAENGGTPPTIGKLTSKNWFEPSQISETCPTVGGEKKDISTVAVSRQPPAFSIHRKIYLPAALTVASEF